MMMANQSGAIARFLVKWLVIPVGLAAIGFFLIGPRIAAKGRAEAKLSTANSSPSGEPSEAPKITGDPEVKISSTPVNRRRAPRRRTPRNEDSAPKPAREEREPADPPSPDEAPPAKTGDG